MRSAKKRRADKADRLGHALWNFDRPEEPPTQAADGAECDDDEEPFSYLDSGHLRELLQEWLIERASDPRAYYTGRSDYWD